jgi:hypothetical protein
LKNGKEVTIQPKRKNWDIGFTVFTNEVFYSPGVSAGSYVYADFVISNITDGLVHIKLIFLLEPMRINIITISKQVILILLNLFLMIKELLRSLNSYRK